MIYINASRIIFKVISADEAESSDSDSDDNDENEDADNDDDEEEGSSDDEKEEGKFKGNRSLYYELFNAIKSYKIDGRSAADPFNRLPNRRCIFIISWFKEKK